MASFDKPTAMEEVFTGFINGKTLPYKSIWKNVYNVKMWYLLRKKIF